MVCTSDGNPHPAFNWTTLLLDDGTSTTFAGAELTVDVCKLTAWNQKSEKKNAFGNVRLMLTCHAHNTVRGQKRTSSVQEVYDLTLLTNMDKVCGEFIFAVLCELFA